MILLYYDGIMNPARKPDLADKYPKIIGKRKLYPPLNSYSAFIQGSEYNIQRYFEKWYNNEVKMDLFVHMKEGYSQVWLPEDDLIDASRYAFKEFLNNRPDFTKREEYLKKSSDEIDRIYSEYKYSKIRDEKWESLFGVANVIKDIIWGVNGAVIFTIYLDKELCLKVLEEQKSSISKQDIDAMWERAIEPAFQSFDLAQHNHFRRLTKSGISGTDLTEACQYFLTDYYSARTLSEVDKVLKERFVDLLDESNHSHDVFIPHEKWLGTLSTDQKEVAIYLQTVMRIRDLRKNFFAKGLTVMYRIAERMFEEAGVERDLIPYYTVRELFKGVGYLKSVASSLPERKKGFQWLVPYVGEPEALVIDIDLGVEKVNTYFKDCHSDGKDSNTIKGQSAFKGKIKGKVRIVTNVNSNHGFINGEILVAGMTRPEYVPLMKMAAGIITDEGGITCHAAIISRELKIPCVIGTKIATKLLKDGDMVEVDADNGIVRILK